MPQFDPDAARPIPPPPFELVSLRRAEISAVFEQRGGRPGDRCAEIVRQNATDNHVFFILSGKVHVVVNGRKVNSRAAGQHVGEMSLVDPKARRSASVVAAETEVVAKVSESDFARMAERYPRLWRLIALELGER